MRGGGQVESVKNMDLSPVQKEIVDNVSAFRDEIVEGKVDKEVIKNHGIPDEYLGICRDKNHPSSKKMNARLFQYLQRRVGYYDNIDKEDNLKIISARLKELLWKPNENNSQENLYMPIILFWHWQMIFVIKV